MANGSEKVGEVRVDITADDAQLRAGLRKAEGVVKQSADKMGKSAKVTPTAGAAGMDRAKAQADEVGPEIDKAETKARGLLGTLRNVRQALSRLFIPVAIVLMADRLLAVFKNIGRELKEIQDGLDGIVKTQERMLEVEAASLRNADELTKRMLALNRERRDGMEAIQKLLDGEIEKQHTVLELLKDSLNSLVGGAPWYEQNRNLLEAAVAAQKKLNDAVNERIKLAALEAEREKAKTAEMEKQERIQRRMKEQSKQDVLGTVIHASRFAPALDLLQRQRSGN